MRPRSAGACTEIHEAAPTCVRRSLATWLSAAVCWRRPTTSSLQTAPSRRSTSSAGSSPSPSRWSRSRSPAIPRSRSPCTRQGARVVGVPIDQQGIVVDALPRGARLVCVTPSHQFPLGMPMSLARRTGTPGMGEEQRCSDRRGRLRQPVPLQRPAVGDRSRCSTATGASSMSGRSQRCSCPRSGSASSSRRGHSRPLCVERST